MLRDSPYICGTERLVTLPSRNRVGVAIRVVVSIIRARSLRTATAFDAHTLSERDRVTFKRFLPLTYCTSQPITTARTGYDRRLLPDYYLGTYHQVANRKQADGFVDLLPQPDPIRR